MTNDSGKKPREFWLHKAFEMGWTVHNEPIIAEHPLEKVIHVREAVSCPNCERLEDEILKLSGCPKCGIDRRYDLHDKIAEIDKLKKQLEMCIEALKLGTEHPETGGVFWRENILAKLDGAE